VQQAFDQHLQPQRRHVRWYLRRVGAGGKGALQRQPVVGQPLAVHLQVPGLHGAQFLDYSMR
jgi:hypothetical protein